MSIVFTPVIPFNSGFPTSLRDYWERTINPEILQLPGENSEITYSATYPAIVNSIAVSGANPSYVPTIPSWVCSGSSFMWTGHLESIFTTVGDIKTVYDYTVGQNQSGTKSAHLTCQLEYNRHQTYNEEFKARFYFKIVSSNPYEEVEYLMRTETWTLTRTNTSSQYCRFYFGAALMSVPGRNFTMDSAILVVFGGSGGNPVPNDIADFKLSGSGTTIRTYSFSAGSNRNRSSSNAGEAWIMGAVDLSKLSEVYNITPTVTEFSPEAGPESAQGGMNEPAFDDRSDTITLPDDPELNLSQMGFFNVYCTDSISSLNNLHDYVFGTAITTQSSTEDILKAIGNNIFNSKLIDYIVSCHVIPVAPIVDSTPTVTAVNLGNVTCSDVLMTKVRTDYVTFDCGSINLSEYYENFADFLETAKLFLPFIGFVPCRPEWFKNTTLSVQYKFNVIDGSCMAFVMSSGRYTNNSNSGTTVVGQYSGTASIRFPITGVSYASMATGIIGSIASMSVASGAGSMLGVAGSAINMAQQKPEIAQSNGYNACASMLGVRRPFLYIERPVSSYAKNYQHELGIPSNIYARLGSLFGYVRMDNVHLDGIPCTDEERNKIASLLKSGVVV